MRLGKGLAIGLVATSCLLLSGCGTKNKEHAVTAVGSTAMQPLVQKAGSDFQQQNQQYTVTVQGGGSGTGLSQAETGAVNIGNSDIFAEQKDGIHADRLQDHRVAVVGIAPVSNEHNGVNNLTQRQLAAIFTGKIKNWKEVGGKDLPIIVINRAQGSGTRKTFEAKVLKGQQPVKSQEQDSNGTVKKIVQNTPGTISYLSLPYLNRELQTVKVDGVAPTPRNITTNKWKIWSYEHMYTSKQPSKPTQAFLAYLMSKPVQAKLVKEAGYVSIHDMKVHMTPDDRVLPGNQ
ncbi:phosphate ABC transporter substrate-binding protein [Fructilactobacillus myrtifloralis]|uniref:Phosphate-binding protein n=1 Tax=Fructilactobacillus myrtifloralis TaxID=2940301 RepID=A0ABY5BMB5_9LACO|nr:phosphate ABC transporter substrate-binding protein [Fructilactobacillus myrtifloralis]USS84823.1 phosphate ABC transporter substrate-binding protein [Fructilactobacillus myrtifloralis]